MVLPHGDVVWLFLLQCFKEQIERRLIVVVLLFCAAVFNHVENGFHVLIFNRGLMQQIEHERGVKCCFRLLPERIICFCALWSGVFDEIVDQFEHVRVLTDVTKRVVAVGFGWVDQIKHTQHIPLFQKQISNGAEHFSLRIGHDKAGICKHEIRLCQKPRLARTGAADDDLQQISAMQLAVHAHLQVLGQYDIFACILVAVLFVQFPDAAP